MGIGWWEVKVRVEGGWRTRACILEVRVSDLGWEMYFVCVVEVMGICGVWGMQYTPLLECLSNAVCYISNFSPNTLLFYPFIPYFYSPPDTIPTP